MKYNEDMRPRLHFTPRAGFLNDPNGLAYDERSHTYHVCFQYQRDVNCDLYIGWRHAVGDHLCALREQGTVIEPNPYGVIFSGSSVRDEKNASGLFGKEGANLLSFYTVHDLETKHEYQAMSYSADGVSWTPYRGGAPVIDNENDRYGVNAFRDPKVVRCDEDTWLMIVGGGVLRLFASRDLRHWEFQSEIENTDAEDAEITEKLLILQKYLPDNATHGEKMISECPDLFPMGNKWILSGGGLFYVVGRVEKKNGKYAFIAESGSALSRVRQNFSRTAASLTPCRPFPTVAASPFSGIWIRPRGRSKTSPGTARFPFPYNCVCKAAACAHIPQGKSIGSLRKSYFAPRASAKTLRFRPSRCSCSILR